MNPKPNLQYASNMFGPLKGEAVARIEAYCASPSYDGWDDISGIIISGNFTSIWNVICELDSTFPNVGRKTDSDSKIVREWSRIPTAAEVCGAIDYATR